MRGPPAGPAWHYEIFNCDPTSSTYHQFTPGCPHESGDVPTNGRWVQGQIVWNILPSAGEPLGWRRLTIGTGNTLGTDWEAIGIA